MNRREWLRALAPLWFGYHLKAESRKPIQLHVDLIVASGREGELETVYRQHFEPTIRRQPGFVQVKLLKLRSEIAGKAPPGSRYRLIISFQTEELRQKWVASQDHQRVWPLMEKNLTGEKYRALLYDEV